MKLLGIIGAMEEEVAALKEAMTGVEVTEKAGMTFVKGMLCGCPAVVVRSGVCKVNSAICAHILADDFQVDAVINTGIAGSLDAKIDIGDIVISTEAMYHDVEATVWGYAPGEIPQMGGVVAFPADEGLIKLAQECCHKANPEIGTHPGRILSGDQFISSQEKKDELKEKFHGKCCEMEGAGIAQAAYLNKVPYVILRAISDKADNSAVMAYEEFEKEAICHCVKLVKEMAAAWSAE